MSNQNAIFRAEAIVLLGSAVIGAPLTPIVVVGFEPNAFYAVQQVVLARTLGVAAATVEPRGREITAAPALVDIRWKAEATGPAALAGFADKWTIRANAAGSIDILPFPDIVGDTFNVAVTAYRIAG